MKQLKILFPWTDLRPTEGFFVPTLDPEKTKELGLRAAVPHRIRAAATPCIKDGLLGVWFCRLRPGQPQRL